MAATSPWLPMYRRARLGIGYLPQEMSIFRGLSVEDNILSILEIAVPDRTSRRESWRNCSRNSPSNICAAPRLWPCRGANGVGSRLPAVWQPGPSMCCSTSPLPGSIRLPWARSGPSCRPSCDRGIGVLITDHNVRETLEIVDRAYILHDGKVLMSGTTDEVIRDEKVRSVYLGQTFRVT
jgi:lipopolysaccharide export system ATP-binding protein